MSDTAYVVKVFYDDAPNRVRWVMAGRGRALGTRENATVFPNREAADAEAKIWKATSQLAPFTVVVEPA